MSPSRYPSDMPPDILQVLRELLLLIPSWDGIEGEVRQFMEAIVTASKDILNVLPGGMHLPVSIGKREL